MSPAPPLPSVRRPSVGRLLADAALAWLAGCAAATLLLPPLGEATRAAWPLLLAAAGTLVLALPLHAALLGMAARRLGGSAIGWVALALLFPVGGAAALLLLAGQWRGQPPQVAPGAR